MTQQKHLKIAIVEADSPNPDIAANYGSYGDIFTKLLLEAGLPKDSVITTHHVVEHPENLPDIENDTFDAVLISGSKHTSYHDIDWINKLSDFTAAAIAKDIKVIGEFSFLFIFRDYSNRYCCSASSC